MSSKYYYSWNPAQHSACCRLLHFGMQLFASSPSQHPDIFISTCFGSSQQHACSKAWNRYNHQCHPCWQLEIATPTIAVGQTDGHSLVPIFGDEGLLFLMCFMDSGEEVNYYLQVLIRIIDHGNVPRVWKPQHANHGKVRCYFLLVAAWERIQIESAQVPKHSSGLRRPIDGGSGILTFVSTKRYTVASGTQNQTNPYKSPGNIFHSACCISCCITRTTEGRMVSKRPEVKRTGTWPRDQPD